ncbi:MAG: phosphatidylglycerophosphatase A [candidate division WOR-3 bacterium]|nr:MAG: phosphatidylglycerophosphatase A [candidate division WOR-3 bacterium]
MAPATFSCLIGILIWYLLFPFKVFYIVVAVIFFVTGIAICNDLSKEWGKDPRRIVIDEYVAILLPLYFTPQRIIPLAITVILFRFFDIVKPPPIRKLENLSGGWGIMFDDLLAAVYTTIIVLFLRLIPLNVF